MQQENHFGCSTFQWIITIIMVNEMCGCKERYLKFIEHPLMGIISRGDEITTNYSNATLPEKKNDW